MKRASNAMAALGVAHRPMSTAENTLCPLAGCGLVLDIDTDGAGRLVEACARHGVVGRHRPHLVIEGAAGIDAAAAQAPGRIERLHVPAPLPYAINGHCPHCQRPRPVCDTCGQAPRAKGRRDCASCVQSKRATRQAIGDVRPCACGCEIRRDPVTRKFARRCATCDPKGAARRAYWNAWNHGRHQAKPT